jgi:hypothetical protein
VFTQSTLYSSAPQQGVGVVKRSIFLEVVQEKCGVDLSSVKTGDEIETPLSKKRIFMMRDLSKRTTYVAQASQNSKTCPIIDKMRTTYVAQARTSSSGAAKSLSLMPKGLYIRSAVR